MLFLYEEKNVYFYKEQYFDFYTTHVCINMLFLKYYCSYFLDWRISEKVDQIFIRFSKPFFVTSVSSCLLYLHNLLVKTAERWGKWGHVKERRGASRSIQNTRGFAANLKYTKGKEEGVELRKPNHCHITTFSCCFFLILKWKTCKKKIFFLKAKLVLSAEN